eukprot:TRINITY_DN842_c0_g1_i3.p1 TRINITY_DN842_c0_g1~~TRINITY_DN842_c0_g1_i3.p1  ORF type:complete len:500 (-),score=148.44 TRINITY_DN842_c0_g1_i3:181-1680(-)
MDDLDALLEDLGRPKSTATSSASAGVSAGGSMGGGAKKQRAASSRVDLNELEDLMQDLASPSSSSSSKPAAARASVSQATVVSKPAAQQPAPSSASNNRYSTSSDADDLDALMASLNSTSARESVRIAPKPAAQPAVSRPVSQAPSRPVSQAPSRPVSQSPSKPAPASSSMDDLDELLNNLEPSRASVVVNSRPVSQAPKPAASKPVASSPSRPVSQAPSKPASRPVTAKPSAKPLAGDDLDNLLSNLTTQMTDIDTSAPTARGTCASCRKAIIGEVIQALGKTFHPEHFVCGNCQNPLGTSNFYEQEGQANCERCYQELFCARCAHCDEPILDRCVTALNKKWHINHFICTQCLGPFPGGSFFERDGRPYCEGCFYGAFASRCAGCQQPIRGECVNALGQQWHPEHFVCQYCQKSFAGGTFYEHGGKPYCETHYHQQTGSLCSGCGKAITGRCVNALDKKWHPEHFVCAFCMNPLAGGSFTENAGKAYCKDCHGKLFS